MSSDTAVVDFMPDNAKDPSSTPAQVSTTDDCEPIPFYGIFPEHRKGDAPVVSVGQAFPKAPEVSMIDPDKQKALDEKCILSALPRDSDSTRSDIAFGDGDGTSAFVNENGELISIVQMLNMGPCGFFRARPNYRLEFEEDGSFHDIIRGRKSGMGLSLVHDDLSDHRSNQIGFVHDRWPRISSRYKNWDLEIQLAIKDRRVIQHYILRSRHRVKVKFAFNAAYIIDTFYHIPDYIKGTCHVRGGTFTTGATAITLAGGAGGHIRFFASLFKDAKPATLDLSSEKATSSENDPPPLGYSYSIEPTDSDRSDWVSNLIQDFEIEMLEGETRTVTAIYHFECEDWKRDQVYSLHLMPEDLPAYNEKKHRNKEKDFMEEYEKMKADSDYGRARSLLEQGMQTLLAINSEELEEEKLGQREAQKMNQIVPFSNWGGEAFSSHRLFGLEWKLDKHGNEYMSLQSRSAFDKIFAQVRETISYGHGKTVAIRMIILDWALIVFQVPQFIDVQEFLLLSCCGHWHTSLGNEKTSFLFRRHLQHLLFVSATPLPWDRDEKIAFFFTNGYFFPTTTDRPTSL